MLRTRVRPADCFGRAGLPFLLLLLITTPVLSQIAPGVSVGPGDSMQSDGAAIQAMRNVLAQSGGHAAWESVRSAQESFSVTRMGDKSGIVHLLLDDWSLDTTRYRNAVHGQPNPPTDHNGTQTFTAQLGTSQYAVQEFDQARTLVSHLPAAAAEVMLRRKEYVLKVSTSRACESGNVCVDVFRVMGPRLPRLPEQQWTIVSSSGLPVTVRVALPRVGNAMPNRWEEIRYLRYAAEGELVIPVTTEHITAGPPETWTFLSFKGNCGFNPTAFDKEIVQ